MVENNGCNIQGFLIISLNFIGTLHFIATHYILQKLESSKILNEHNLMATYYHGSFKTAL